jgi:hypothetical protein
MKPVMCMEHASEDLHAHFLDVCGLLLPLSLHICAETIRDFNGRSRVVILPLTYRDVHVTSYTRRYSEPQLRIKQVTSPIVPALPGHVSKHTETLETSVPTPHDGEFRADRKFWADEEELQQELQHVLLLLVGTHECYEKTLRAGTCWVEGIVLRSIDPEAPSSDRLSRYERIGWLSYNTLKNRDEWSPEGFKSRFLLG